MREIEARGRQLDIAIWTYGYLTKNHKSGTAYITGQNNRTGCAIPERVDPETVGEYVRKDSEGVKIYRGDIVRITSIMDEVSVGEVVWQEKDAKYVVDIGMDFVGFDTIEHCDGHILAIGNIHDNPELLK